MRSKNADSRSTWWNCLCQAGGEVEAEPVHVHLAHPVPQRVDDQLQHVRLPHVQRVPGACGVEVVASAVGQQVVRRVVDALEGQHRAELVALRGVVVDHVEDDLDAGLVHGPHQVLELGDDLFDTPRRVIAVRGEEADRVVSPVVPQAVLHQMLVVHEVMDRHQLDRGDAEPLQVLDDGGVRHARVRALQVVGDLGVTHGEALDVGLVHHGLMPRDAQLPVVAPLEPWVGDHRPRHERRAVRVVAFPVVAAERVTVNGGVPPDLAVDRRGVGIEQQLARIAPQAVLRVVRAVDAVAVTLPVADPRQEAVPHVAVDLGHVQPLFRGAALVEQAQLDSLGYLGKQREVRPDAVVAWRRADTAGPATYRVPWSPSAPARPDLSRTTTFHSF